MGGAGKIDSLYGMYMSVIHSWTKPRMEISQEYTPHTTRSVPVITPMSATAKSTPTARRRPSAGMREALFYMYGATYSTPPSDEESPLVPDERGDVQAKPCSINRPSEDTRAYLSHVYGVHYTPSPTTTELGSTSPPNWGGHLPG